MEEEEKEEEHNEQGIVTGKGEATGAQDATATRQPGQAQPKYNISTRSALY